MATVADGLSQIENEGGAAGEGSSSLGFVLEYPIVSGGRMKGAEGKKKELEKSTSHEARCRVSSGDWSAVGSRRRLARQTSPHLREIVPSHNNPIVRENC